MLTLIEAIIMLLVSLFGYVPDNLTQEDVEQIVEQYSEVLPTGDPDDLIPPIIPSW